MAKIRHLRPVIWVIALMWILFLASLFIPLTRYGIYPRQIRGLIGIGLSPFLHQNILHIWTNTIFMGIFGAVSCFIEGRRITSLLIFIALVGNSLVWALARPGNHIGASGLVFGLFGYLLLLGYFRRRFLYILVSLFTLLLYGGMIFGVLPLQRHISFEAHLFGFLAGAIAAKYR